MRLFVRGAYSTEALQHCTKVWVGSFRQVGFLTPWFCNAL